MQHPQPQQQQQQQQPVVWDIPGAVPVVENYNGSGEIQGEGGEKNNINSSGGGGGNSNNRSGKKKGGFWAWVAGADLVDEGDE